MANEIWGEALRLLEAGDIQVGAELLEKGMKEAPNDPKYLYVLGRYFLVMGQWENAANVLSRSLAAEPNNIDIQFSWAFARKRLGTHRGIAEARDVLLSIIDNHPVPTQVLREAAQCCFWVGPVSRAKDLWRQTAEQSGWAEDYYWLSECLATIDDLHGAVEAIRKAVAIDPQRYGKSLEDLELAEHNQHEKSSAMRKARYPDTTDIQADLKRTIIDFVAADCKDVEPFVTKETKFFTMGSCFARNIVRALSKQGYNASNMDISEYINTTYANRYFVDWLEDSLEDEALISRIQELLPENFSKEILMERIRTCDVFILTLGVAPAFFDRQTGQFVLPRPTALNSRALAEKYKFRTTTVQENVDNVIYLLSYIKKVNKNVKIVITESPVPLHMTFEFKSAVMADCISKSTLRVAAHQIVSEGLVPDILYWPSFEVFRWIGAHTGPVYGVDDGASWHVSEELVNTVIQCFLEMLSVPVQ